MSSFELNKLQGVSAPRTLSESDRSQLQSRADEAANTRLSPSDKPGIAVEVSQNSAADKPPVDGERVNEIRNALRDGSYPLVPAKIVDAMIAARVSPSIPQGQQS